MTMSMKVTYKGSFYELTSRPAPKDANGNTRLDIISTKDGVTYNPSIKGFRKIKVGYRVQLASFQYSIYIMFDELVAKIKAIDPIEQPSLIAAEPRSSMHKDAKSLIREYIIDNMSDDDYGTFDTSEMLHNVVEGFAYWYGPYEQRKTPNVQNAFTEWLKGMPSELHATPFYEEQCRLMNQWLGTNGKTYSDDVTSFRFYALIFREFNKICRLNNVEDVYKRINR